jgi:hypothetical protein
MEVGKFESVEHDQVNWMQDGFEIFEKKKTTRKPRYKVAI